MKDRVHTNAQRIEKIRSVFIAISQIATTVHTKNGKHDATTQLLLALDDAAKEADGSLEAIESFIANRNALNRIS